VADHERECAKGADSVDLTLLRPVLVEFASDSGALIPVLQRAQAIYGYLPCEVLLEIAERRRTPFSDVYGVATFYAQFHLQPRGATVVRVCDRTACHVAGSAEVARAIVGELGVAMGETAADGSITVESVAFHFADSPANRITGTDLDPTAKIPELKVTPVRVRKVSGA